ncbi:LysR family transcriptional regulator [Vibrio sp. PP-XX7]
MPAISADIRTVMTIRYDVRIGVIIFSRHELLDSDSLYIFYLLTKNINYYLKLYVLKCETFMLSLYTQEKRRNTGQRWKTEDIKLFHFIVDAGNLTKASELLDLPKSNLSRRLKNLEMELKVDLFHRHRRAMTLSENGRQFYERTKPIIIELETVIETMVETSLN